MKRMTDKRWKHIQKLQDFVGITLRDELISARRADLEHIHKIEKLLLQGMTINADQNKKINGVREVVAYLLKGEWIGDQKKVGKTLIRIIGLKEIKK